MSYSEIKTYHDFVATLNNIFDDAANQLSIMPATPEEQHDEGDIKARKWIAMKSEIIRLFGFAYHVIPMDLPEGASTRTAMLERAIHEMTAKLVQYPSSPYTLDSTESLGRTLIALKTSMEIDAMNREADER